MSKTIEKKNYRPMTEEEIKEVRTWLNEHGYDYVVFNPIIPIDA